VFGHVIEGQEVVKAVEKLQVDENSRPLVDVSISSCGELVLQVRPKGMPAVPFLCFHLFPGSAETLVNRDGKINYRLIAYPRQHFCEKLSRSVYVHPSYSLPTLCWFLGHCTVLQPLYKTACSASTHS